MEQGLGAPLQGIVTGADQEAEGDKLRGEVPYQLHLTCGRDLFESACVSSDLHLFSYNQQLYKRKLPTCLTAEGQNWKYSTKRVNIAVPPLLFSSRPAGLQDWAS